MDSRNLRIASALNELKAIPPTIEVCIKRVREGMSTGTQEELHGEVDKAIKLLHRMRQLIILVKNL